MQKLRAFKEKDNKPVLCCYYIQKRGFIIDPKYFDANDILSHPFIQNLKHKPNMVQDLSRKNKIAPEKQRLDNSVKHQMHQILRNNIKNGKIEYRGRTYAKNEVLLESGWISDDFEFFEPKFYKLGTTVTRNDDIQKIYTVLVGQCNQQKLVEDYKYEDKRNNSLIFPGESISKNELSKIPEKKTVRLYIVPGAVTLLYQQGNDNSRILLSLASA